MNLSLPRGFREIRHDGSVADYRIEGWSDLLAAPVQDALQRCHASDSRLVCTCRQHQSLWPPLTARLRSNYFSCLRLCVREHAFDCIFHSLYGEEPQKPYSPSIFALPRETATIPSSEKSDSQHERPESTFFHLTYSRFCERATATATVESFLSANKDVPTQPTGTQFFSALDSELLQPRFPGPADAYCSAREQGTVLRFGLIFRPPVSKGTVDTLVSVAAWSKGTPRLETWLISAAVLDKALAALNGLNSLIAPPWLVIAAVEPDGRVRRIWLKGVWSDGIHLTTAESQYERLAPLLLLSQGEVFIKPVLRDDVPELLSRFGHSDAGSFAWRHVPDYLCWRGVNSTVLGRLVELRGFRPGDFPEYDKNMEEKLKLFRRLGTHWQVEPINGWDIPPQPACIQSPAEWKSPLILPGGLSPAARTWISRSLKPNPTWD